MRVRLIKKLAEKIDGVDLSGRSVGDLLNLKPQDARLLIAERWAVPGGDNSSGLTRSRACESDQPRDDEDTR
jgi:hypothetical protein